MRRMKKTKTRGDEGVHKRVIVTIGHLTGQRGKKGGEGQGIGDRVDGMKVPLGSKDFWAQGAV